MPQYNRNDLEIAARNQHFTRDTFEKVLRLKTIVVFRAGGSGPGKRGSGRQK